MGLPRIAAALPLTATDASLERRLRRWLANATVDAPTSWATLVPALLASRAGQEVTLVFDPTPHHGRATILLLGLVCHRRVLPLAWAVVPQQDEPWAEDQATILARLMATGATARPPGCPVTLLGDRGITGPRVIDRCAARGWHSVLRRNAGPNRHGPWRPTLDRPDRRVWSLVTGPGHRWSGTGQRFKAAGWRDGALTIWWARTAAEPWILVSDRPGGVARVREYRRRAHGEATDQDGQGRGFDLERSKRTDLVRLDRLLLALHLALWWGLQLGLRTIRHGRRRRSDRPGRRDLSVLRLGRLALLEADHHGRGPPLPFHRRDGTWRSIWLA